MGMVRETRFSLPRPQIQFLGRLQQFVDAEILKYEFAAYPSARSRPLWLPKHPPNGLSQGLWITWRDCQSRLSVEHDFRRSVHCRSDNRAAGGKRFDGGQRESFIEGGQHREFGQCQPIPDVWLAAHKPDVPNQVSFGHQFLEFSTQTSVAQANQASRGELLNHLRHGFYEHSVALLRLEPA